MIDQDLGFFFVQQYAVGYEPDIKPCFGSIVHRLDSIAVAQRLPAARKGQAFAAEILYLPYDIPGAGYIDKRRVVLSVREAETIRAFRIAPVGHIQLVGDRPGKTRPLPFDDPFQMFEYFSRIELIHPVLVFPLFRFTCPGGLR
jgi:hypothetical protein